MQINRDSVEKALNHGPVIGSELSEGIMLATGKRDGTAAGPWCAIYISFVAIQPDVQNPPMQAQPQAVEVAVVEEPLPLATPAVGLVEPEAPVTANGFSDADQIAHNPAAELDTQKIIEKSA